MWLHALQDLSFITGFSLVLYPRHPLRGACYISAGKLLATRIYSRPKKRKNSLEDRQSWLAWQTVNEVSRRKSTNRVKQKSSYQEERFQKWKEHFKNLLENPPEVPDKLIKIINKPLDIKFGQFPEEEFDAVLKINKSKTAAGFDEIPLEFSRSRKCDDVLLRVCNAVYKQKTMKDMRKAASIISQERWTRNHKKLRGHNSYC